MKWFKEYLSFLFFGPWREVKRSKYYRVLLALQVISTCLTFAGIFFTLRIPLPDWSTKTWLIAFLLSVIGTLLLLVEGLRRYDNRTTDDLREEWLRRSKKVVVLTGYIVTGQELVEKCETLGYEKSESISGSDYADLKNNIRKWNKDVAYDLIREAQLDKSYKARFYEDCKTGEDIPEYNKCRSWMKDRLVILREFRQEFDQPPPELLSSKQRTRLG